MSPILAIAVGIVLYFLWSTMYNPKKEKMCAACLMR